MMSTRCRSTYKGHDVDDVNKKEGAQSRHHVDLMLLKIITPTLNRINKYNANTILNQCRPRCDIDDFNKTDDAQCRHNVEGMLVNIAISTMSRMYT